jgi:hypothetical protein
MASQLFLRCGLMRVVPLGTHHRVENLSVQVPPVPPDPHSSGTQHPGSDKDTAWDDYAHADALVRVIQDDISMHHLTNKYLKVWLSAGLSLEAMEEEWLQESDRLSGAVARGSAGAGAAFGSSGIEYRMWDAAASLASLLRWLHRVCPRGSMTPHV